MNPPRKTEPSASTESRRSGAAVVFRAVARTARRSRGRTRRSPRERGRRPPGDRRRAPPTSTRRIPEPSPTRNFIRFCSSEQEVERVVDGRSSASIWRHPVDVEEVAPDRGAVAAGAAPIASTTAVVRSGRRRCRRSSAGRSRTPRLALELEHGEGSSPAGAAPLRVGQPPRLPPLPRPRESCPGVVGGDAVVDLREEQLGVLVDGATN